MAIRKLVKIRKVTEIIPIEGADLIELARVDGWKCVVKKNIFKVGDYGVYFEVDSFLPAEDNRYGFLRSRCLKKMLVEGKGLVDGIRIRTVKLKNVESHGLLLPLSDFPEIDIDDDIGIDLSERLNVLKYEEPVPAQISGTVKGAIPTIIRRTDQERINRSVHGSK